MDLLYFVIYLIIEYHFWNIQIDWKTDACWENNNPADFLTKKLTSKFSHDVRVFSFLFKKNTITNLKQSWLSMVYKKRTAPAVKWSSRVDLQPFFFSSNQSILSASGSQAKVNGAWDGPECFINDNVIHNQKKSLAWMWFFLLVTSIMAIFVGQLFNVL